MKLPHTEVKFYPEVKFQTGLSSLRVSYKRALKYGLFKNTRFRERSNMAVTPNFWVTIRLHKKECLPVITRNKKDSSEQVITMIYTLGKYFFATATFQS